MKIAKIIHIKSQSTLPRVGLLEIFFSLVFTLILVGGYALSTNSALDIYSISRGSVLAYFCASVVIGTAILICLMALKKHDLKKSGRPDAVLFQHFSDRKLWLWTSFLIFICYLPIILMSVAELSPDSWTSISQVTGATPWANTQPVIFTAFVSLFIHVGLFLGSLDFGIFLFSIVQSAILAMVFASVVVWMRRERISKYAILVTFFFYALLPINSIAGTIMWKDILYAGFGLLFLILLRKLYLENSAFFTRNNVIYFVALAFLFCAWRNNGFYTYLMFLVLISIRSYKIVFSKKYILMLASPIALFIIYSAFISSVAKPTSVAETLSVPLQQIARTVKYHSNSIPVNDRESINKILPYNQLGSLYNPNLSDPVKSSLNVKSFDSNKAKYLNLWFSLLYKDKKTYLAAFLYNTYGYVYPFQPSTSVTDITLNNASIPNALEKYKDSAYNRGSKQAIGEYRNIVSSVAPILFNIGLYTCLILLASYVAIIRKKHELYWIFVALFCLFFTTILGPVNGEFRYLYLFVVAMPLIIGSLYSNRKPEGTKKHG